jgi:alpha-mannosidase
MPVNNAIQEVISRLRKLTELELQNNWYFTEQELTNPPLEISPTWQKGQVNEKNYLVWEKGNKVRWFAQKIAIPHSLNADNYPLENLSLRVKLTWWAESAQVFVDGKLINEGDLFDSSCRVLLTAKCQPEQEFTIALRLVSPGHDIGGLMISQCLYENEYGKIDPSFVSNELAVIAKYIENFYPEKQADFTNLIQQINWSTVNNQSLFHQELEQLRKSLLPFSSLIKERSFHLLGHAHLDMAWLWTIEETYEVAQRTFNSVLNLQKTDHNLTFGHTTAYLYQWIEEHNPSLFEQIKTAIVNNKWEVLGGMWVEPEVNLINGESLVRQLLYGQKYCLEKFGEYNRVAWLPDTFGFPWQLPQILQQAEIDYFVTGKLHWNDTNKFPHGCFWWQSPDGSQIFTSMSPPNIAGVMDTHPLVMTDYSVNWENQTGLQDSFWIPGVGDHGGGPTRDMLEVAKRYQDSPFFPQINFTTASQYLDRISTVKNIDFPVWDDELYLELHRGCYTTHGDQKYYNRYAEKLLYQAELFSTISTILESKFNQKQNIHNNKQDRIKSIWEKVLLNQFHDILPGTSIPSVFTESNQLWQEVIQEGKVILDDSLRQIANYIQVPQLPHPEAQPIVIFNSLNWMRSQIVELDIDGNYYSIYDENNQRLNTQISYDHKLLFLASNIPSVGYKLFFIVPLVSADKINHNLNNKIQDKYIIENNYLRVIINNNNGNIESLFDLVNQRKILREAGNELQLFEDQGQYWDAWNIDPDYQNHPLSSPQLQSISFLDKGTLRQIIRVEKNFNNSTFIQDYILEINSPILKIKNQVNWQEDYTLLKVNFPLTIESDFVTYEIACGTIQRTTKPTTDREKAQWEVYGHQWADLGNDDYGVSLLNDSKYGYDSTPNQLRLSLLRSPKWPDPQCDRGIHHFTYGLYPHKNSWQQANTVQKGYEFNVPLLTIFLAPQNYQTSSLPPTGELLNLGVNNLVLMCLKLAEDEPAKIIVRGYECHHESTFINLQGILNLRIQEQVNLLENRIQKIESAEIVIKGSQIFTLKCS